MSLLVVFLLAVFGIPALIFLIFVMGMIRRSVPRGVFARVATITSKQLFWVAFLVILAIFLWWLTEFAERRVAEIEREMAAKREVVYQMEIPVGKWSDKVGIPPGQCIKVSGSGYKALIQNRETKVWKTYNSFDRIPDPIEFIQFQSLFATPVTVDIRFRAYGHC